MNMKSNFIHALETGNIEELRKVPKAEMHTHLWASGCRQYIFEKTGRRIKPLTHKLVGTHGMGSWAEEALGDCFDHYEGHKLLIEAAFVQANNDGIVRLCMGENTDIIQRYYHSDINLFMTTLNIARNTYAPKTHLLPQVGFTRHKPVELQYKQALPFFEQNYFEAIDLFGDELATPIETFKPIYRKAKEKGMILRAHVGEKGTADDIMRAVEVLELDEVQHGIAAASSKKIMNFLADNQIQLNICPTSNVLLGFVECLEKHPIRTLFDNSVKVTINTDDILMFGSSVSQEFLSLYNCGLFTGEELNCIRENGLNLGGIDE